MRPYRYFPSTDTEFDEDSLILDTNHKNLEARDKSDELEKHSCDEPPPPLKLSSTPVDESKFNDENILSNDMDKSEELSVMDQSTAVHVSRRPPKSWKTFEKLDEAGTEVSYRCVRCRGCKDCKSGAKIEFISIQEEVERGIIDQSVEVNLSKGHVTAKLPFLCDPTKKLMSNEAIARKIYFAQIKKLNIDPKDKMML